MDDQLIQNGTEEEYLTVFPNLLDDAGLDPFSFRLLLHYYRCRVTWEETKLTAQICNMSIKQVANKRKVLEDGGFIKTELQGKMIMVWAVDLWEANISHYFNQKENNPMSAPHADISKVSGGTPASHADIEVNNNNNSIYIKRIKKIIIIKKRLDDVFNKPATKHQAEKALEWSIKVPEIFNKSIKITAKAPDPSFTYLSRVIENELDGVDWRSAYKKKHNAAQENKDYLDDPFVEWIED